MTTVLRRPRTDGGNRAAVRYFKGVVGRTCGRAGCVGGCVGGWHHAGIMAD